MDFLIRLIIALAALTFGAGLGLGAYYLMTAISAYTAPRVWQVTPPRPPMHHQLERKAQ